MGHPFEKVPDSSIDLHECIDVINETYERVVVRFASEGFARLKALHVMDAITAAAKATKPPTTKGVLEQLLPFELERAQKVLKAGRAALTAPTERQRGMAHQILEYSLKV